MPVTIDILEESWGCRSTVKGEIKKDDLVLSFTLLLATVSTSWCLYITEPDGDFDPVRSFPYFKREAYKKKQIIKWIGENHRMLFLLFKKFVRKIK